MPATGPRITANVPRTEAEENTVYFYATLQRSRADSRTIMNKC